MSRLLFYHCQNYHGTKSGTQRELSVVVHVLQTTQNSVILLDN